MLTPPILDDPEQDPTTDSHYVITEKRPALKPEHTSYTHTNLDAFTMVFRSVDKFIAEQEQVPKCVHLSLKRYMEYRRIFGTPRYYGSFDKKIRAVPVEIDERVGDEDVLLIG